MKYATYNINDMAPVKYVITLKGTRIFRFRLWVTQILINVINWIGLIEVVENLDIKN